MLGIQWGERLRAKVQRHPMADAAAAALLLEELPFKRPAKVLAESTAWLESVEAEATFGRAHRMKIVSLIDGATRASLEELTRTYAGAGHGAPGQASDWRTLMAYLDCLGGAYRAILDADPDAPGASLGASLPALACRMMRAIACSMKVSWMRYLPPDRASWEALVHAYRAAQMHNCAETLVMAYPSDTERTCAQHELAVAAMFAAASPESLNPRRVELVYRITSSCRSAFTTGSGNEGGRRHYLVNLDQPSAPVRIPEQLAESAGWMFFHADKVEPRLRALREQSRSGTAGIPDLGTEFAASEIEHAIEHVLRFWDDSPPARREPRTRINTKVQVELGIQAIREALESADARLNPASEPRIVMEGVGPETAQTEQSRGTPIPWTLTDYSARGVGVRCARRVDPWLRIGVVIGVRLERSEKWSVAVVRRIRTDARNQTDVGAQLLTRSAELVTLEGPPSPATSPRSNGGGAVVHSRALLLPDDAQHYIRASLLFEPGTNAPEQTFVLRQGDSARHIRLHEADEVLDGWERVEFDGLD